MKLVDLVGRQRKDTMNQKELIEALQKTIAMQAETIKALLQMVADLQHPQRTLAPIPVQQPINPFPYPYQPYVGDLPVGPSWTSPNIGLGTPIAVCGTAQLGEASYCVHNTIDGRVD